MSFDLNYLFDAPNIKEINAICLSAGAAKGYYQLGACHFLYSQNNFNNINTFIGTSVGSALALLLCIGYEPVEFFSYMCQNDIDDCWEYDISLHQFIINWGAIDHKKFKNYLEKAILEKIGYIPTFEDIYLNLGKIFICSAWCINSKEHKTFFNFIDTPNLSCLDAVIASCAIPGLFTKVEINGKLYIDGALFDFCPVDHILELLSNYLNFSINDLHIIYTKSDINNNKNDCIKIDTLLDYIKEISYIPFYMQKEIKVNDIKNKFKVNTLNYFVINCEHNEITLNLPIKSRIKNFCDGFEQIKDLIS